jgi:hypothetical protein
MERGWGSILIVFPKLPKPKSNLPSWSIMPSNTSCNVDMSKSTEVIGLDWNTSSSVTTMRTPGRGGPGRGSAIGVTLATSFTLPDGDKAIQIKKISMWGKKKKYICSQKIIIKQALGSTYKPEGDTKLVNM